jgi:glycosyltransferase involved in cell wall biosynthesis
VKILQLTTHLNIGGIGNYVVSLAKTLESKGAACIVASGGGDLEGELKACGIEHKRLNIKTKSELSPKVIAATVQLVKILRSEKVDIIHAHTRVSQVVASLASCLTGVPFVTTCHGYFRTRMRKVFDTWGAKVIAISDAVKTHLEKDLGVRPDRVETIYSGVDISRFRKAYSPSEIDEIKKSLGLAQGPVVGTIGRLSPVKGHRYFIDAMQHIQAVRPDVRALIVGNGPEEAALKDLAISSGVDNAVRFMDSVSDTHRVLSVMDVFVFPSVMEGLGIALLEALASGRACVASDIGGIRDIISDGANGILVEVGDSKAIANAVLRLLEDKSLRDVFARKGPETVERRFSLDTWGNKVQDLYRSVLE